MNKRALSKCLAIISAVIMTGCSSSNTPAETAEDTLSAEVTTVSETTVETTSERTTTAEETTLSETSAETTVTAENLSEADFGKYFKTDLDISDYDKRFCGFKFDETIIINSEDEFYLKSGTADMISAAENAVRQSDIWKNTESFCKTAVLNNDGTFTHTVTENGETKEVSRFALDSNVVDENGYAKMLFNCAAVDDFDGDGKKETFLIMTIPSFSWLNDKWDFGVFINSSGEARLLCDGVAGYFEPIRYDGFMHMGISFGVNIISSFAKIYAVENDIAVEKHDAFSLGGHESGITMFESAAQAPGCWLVVWDNVDKIYKEVAAEPVSEELAKEIFNSPLVESLRNDDSRNEDILNDYDKFAESLTMYGGKYITVVPVFSEYCFVYENGELSEFDVPILESCIDSKTVVERISLADAERLAAPAPDEGSAEYAQYTINKDIICTNKDAFISAGGADALSAAEKAVKESGIYKRISHYLKNGGSLSFEQEGTIYTISPEFLDGETVKPLFSSGVYADFDKDGRNEAFIVMRLPTDRHLLLEKKNGEKVWEQELLLFVSSDGNVKVKDRIIFGGYTALEGVIEYGNEAHLLTDYEIISVRESVAVTELKGAVPTGNGVSFNGIVFYDPSKKDYCFARYYPISEELLKKLNDSPEFKAAYPEKTVKKAWIAGESLIYTDDYLGCWLFDGEGFTKVEKMYRYYPEYVGGGICYTVDFLSK